MPIYAIIEKQNLQSIGNAEAVEAKDLADAKRIATRKQVFQGTVLSIEAPNGSELAYKKNGKWTDVDE